MNGRPLLSICIPTYNRAGLLRECLESIEREAFAGLFEVVVSDNASTDDTLAVLNEFSVRLPLRWAVQECNLGYDRNFDAVVALAQGEYCWLLGSDDYVESDAIRKLCEGLQESGADVYQFGYVQGDFALKRLSAVYPPERVVEGSRAALAEFLHDEPNASMLFMFISSFAFRRSLWMGRREFVQTWFDSFYIHVFAIHAALAQGARLASTRNCLVLARGNNPNEFNSVPGKFVALDAMTLQRLVNEIYGGDDRIQAALGQTLRRSYPAKALVHIAANGGFKYINDSQEALLSLGYSKRLLNGIALLNRLKLLSSVKWALNLRRLTIRTIKHQKLLK